MKIDFMRLVMRVEKVFFPVVFCLFSLQNACILWATTKAYFPPMKPVVFVALHDYFFKTEAVFLIALILFNALISYALLVSRNLHKDPEGLEEVLVPLIVTFWEYSYNFIPLFPPQANLLVISPADLHLSIMAGLYISVAGLIIASVSIFQMRKSFGIFVQVRDIVTHGLYRYVRHPIYLGHILASVGFVFLAPRIYTVILCGIGIALVVVRARLEERKLSRFSDDYREYMRQTPFLVPLRFKR